MKKESKKPRPTKLEDDEIPCRFCKGVAKVVKYEDSTIWFECPECGKFEEC